MDDLLIKIGKECCNTLSENLGIQRTNIQLDEIVNINNQIFLRININGIFYKSIDLTINKLCEGIEQEYKLNKTA